MLFSCLNSFFSLLYPPLCLHCETPLDQEETLFCQMCSASLTLIHPLHRCSLCFSETPVLRVCCACRKKRHLFYRKAAALEPAGAALTLLGNLSLKNQPFLAKGAAALLAVQWERLSWPKPDVVAASPIPLAQKMKLGYDPHDLLARHLGKILDIPKTTPLFSRMNDQIALKKGQEISDQTVLLIGGVLDDRMDACGNQLVKACPKRIYGLSLCSRY